MLSQFWWHLSVLDPKKVTAMCFCRTFGIICAMVSASACEHRRAGHQQKPTNLAHTAAPFSQGIHSPIVVISIRRNVLLSSVHTLLLLLILFDEPPQQQEEREKKIVASLNKWKKKASEGKYETWKKAVFFLSTTNNHSISRYSIIIDQL
jgi:hypothetical protein